MFVIKHVKSSIEAPCYHLYAHIGTKEPGLPCAPAWQLNCPHVTAAPGGKGGRGSSINSMLDSLHTKGRYRAYNWGIHTVDTHGHTDRQTDGEATHTHIQTHTELASN